MLTLSTVIPISPQTDGSQEVRHWWPEYLDDVYSSLKSKGYPIDWDQLHLSGYSMGGRGTWRNAVARPDVSSLRIPVFDKASFTNDDLLFICYQLYASLAPSAGAAEKAGDGTLSQQKADSVFDKLDLIKDIPVMQFAGRSDSTAGGDSPKSTEAQLKKVGNDLASLVMESTDHSGMSIIPFDTTLMNWMLKQKKSGASSSVSSSEDDISSSNDDEDNESTSSKARITKTRSSSTSTKTSSAESSKYTQDTQVKVADTGSSSSGSSGTTKKKCTSSAAARRRRAKRAAMLEEGYAFAHPGPVRRGIYGNTPAPSPASMKKRGLSLADIIISSEAHKAETEKKKRSLEENVKAHANQARSAHNSPTKFGRRLSR